MAPFPLPSVSPIRLHNLARKGLPADRAIAIVGEEWERKAVSAAPRLVYTAIT
jgi:hypothetical protein